MRFSRKRLARLRKKFAGHYVGLRQTDGSLKYLRRDRVMATCQDALAGRDTPATRALLCAESTTDDSKVHQLLQALHRPPYVPERRLVQ